MANSCIWYLMMYNKKCLEAYKTIVDTLFLWIREVMSPQYLVIFAMTMPVGYRDSEIPQDMLQNLRINIVEEHFFSATLMNLYKLDVGDMTIASAAADTPDART
ncbi:GDSL/SGNH-like Acyl-Esterase family found in Pmr5 and Cas1p [Pristimantis euphronides]